MARRRKGLNIKALKHTLDKNIKGLSESSAELADILERAVSNTDFSQATEKEKQDLKKLIEDIAYVDDLINRIVKE